MADLGSLLAFSWSWPIAGVLLVSASGCTTHRTEQQELTDRTQRAIDDLERLKPRLAKSGTPNAEALAERLTAVREGLATLPPPAPATVAKFEPPAEPEPPPPPAAVRCPDAGCWRLSGQLEVSVWRLRLDGPGTNIDDTGPVALGLAVGLEHSKPIDHLLEWSWGGEAVITRQDRTGGQYVSMIGLRPFVRAALAINDRWALTVRPLAEVGQADLRLGAEPGAVVDQSGLYAGLGLRGGIRGRLAGGDLVAEVGWRSLWLNSYSGEDSYQVSIDSPECAIGWSGRF